jgi:outer membrane protein, heavy metal efflux system
MLRDIRAATEIAYDQALLDGAQAEVQDETIGDLAEVVKVTQVAYAANQVTQTDFISAEYDLAAARQQQDTFRVAEANDETTINQLLDRRPEEPLVLDRKIELAPLGLPLEVLIDRAAEMRQEILEAALTEKNNATALTLAKMEYLPNYTIGYEFDHFLTSSAGPTVTALQDHSLFFSLNVPIFFWIKQREDVTRANYDLDAARDNAALIRNQTAATVTTLYRNAGLAGDTAALYRDSLIPLARQDFSVALIAYQSGKIDFTTLSGALLRAYTARVAYLQAANQYLAAQVALEQAVGGPVSK